MDELEIEEKLAEQSIIYISNPGPEQIKKLREYYNVVVESQDLIKITYKIV